MNNSDKIPKKPSAYFWKIDLSTFAKMWYNGAENTSQFKQLNVLAYIFQNIKATDNTIIATYQKIADDVGVSKDTVVRIMRHLGKNDFIRKRQNGVYMINPFKLMWGPEEKRLKLYSVYAEANRIDMQSSDSDTSEWEYSDAQ